MSNKGKEELIGVKQDLEKAIKAVELRLSSRGKEKEKEESGGCLFCESNCLRCESTRL